MSLNGLSNAIENWIYDTKSTPKCIIRLVIVILGSGLGFGLGVILAYLLIFLMLLYWMVVVPVLAVGFVTAAIYAIKPDKPKKPLQICPDCGDASNDLRSHLPVCPIKDMY